MDEMMDRLCLSAQGEGTGSGGKRSRKGDDKGGMIRREQTQESSFKQAIIIYPFIYLTLNPSIKRPIAVPSPDPPYHPLPVSMHYAIPSIH